MATAVTATRGQAAIHQITHMVESMDCFGCAELMAAASTDVEVDWENRVTTGELRVPLPAAWVMVEDPAHEWFDLELKSAEKPEWMADLDENAEGTMLVVFWRLDGTPPYESGLVMTDHEYRRMTL